MSGWTTAALVAVLGALGASVVVFAYRDGSILSYNDAFGHMKIARFVVSGHQPGVTQFGGVWLPVQHLLMLPLVWNDWAFRTGVAGSVASLAGFVATGLFVYFLTFRITHQQLAGLVALVVLASNPNVLYMQATPMTDMILPAFITGGTYFLVKWATQPDRLVYLLLGAAMAFLATLTRYEAWAFAVAATAFVAYVGSRQRWGRDAGQAYATGFGLLALYGIALWFIWNALILGDPLYFNRGEFSSSAIDTATRAYLGTTSPPAQGNILVAAGDVLRAAIWNAGPMVALIGGAGFLFWLVRERLRPSQAAVLLLLAPAAMLFLAMLRGDAFILLPDRDDRTHNIRYGLLLLPAIAVYAGYLSKSHGAIKLAVVALALTQAALLVSQDNVVTYIDGTRGLGSGSVRTLSEGGDQTSFQALRTTREWFGQHYDSGLVLIDSSFNNHMLFSGVPTNNLLHEGVYQEWDQALEDPGARVDWIYMHQSGSLHDRVWDALHDSDKMSDFIEVFELDGVSIFVNRRHYHTWIDAPAQARDGPDRTARAPEGGGGPP